MDKTSFIGIFLGVIAVGVGMFLKGASPLALFNPAALLIIFVGTAGAVLIAFPMNEIKRIPALFKVLFIEQKLQTIEDILPQFVHWATIARKEGLLALEQEIENMDDPFLKNGMKMAIDGYTAELLRDMMEGELESIEERHAVGASIFSQAGTYAPTLGVLGAVIGLIAALGNLDDMDTLGPAIAAAFIATLFGIFSGYVLWHPFANKLKMKTQQEIRIKQTMIEAVLAIQEGVAPRVIEEKILTYTPSKSRKLIDEIEKGESING